MDTTVAAAQAGVAVATIRTWCRRGVVAATKNAGRWIVEAPSLARRISIGKAKRMTVELYRIEEGTTTEYGETIPTFTIIRTYGDDWRLNLKGTFRSRESAEGYKAFYERTPVGYMLELKRPTRGGAARIGDHWLISGSTDGDPSTLKREFAVAGNPASFSPEWLDRVTAIVNAHAEGKDARIAKKAEAKVIAAAEETVAQARQQQVTEARQAKGELASPRQVEYILQLLAARQRDGEGGGFYQGPTSAADIQLMSKVEASLYIDSLKGTY